MRIAATLFLLCFALLTGCQSVKQETSAEEIAAALPTKHHINFFSFDPERYPQVHAAIIEVLRQHGFRVARNDYRFGTVTTYPKESPTTLEFWIDDASTYAQRREDTYNAQQRTIKVQVAALAPGDSLEDVLDDLENPEPTYYLSVEVLIQRLQRPERYLTHSASERISARYTAVPTHLSRQGIDGPYAQDLTRDHRLERRLLEAIKAASQP